MNNYRSTAAVYPNCIDSRELFMKVDYCLLTREQASGFFRSFIEWCIALWQNNFVITWYLDDKEINSAKVLDAIQDIDNLSIGLEGAVMSKQISNKRAMKRFARYIERYETEVLPSDASIDYMRFFLEQKAKLESGNISWKEFALSFFRENGRIYCSLPPFPELQGSIFCNAYEHDSSLYHGSISVLLSMYSAGGNVAELAAEMTRFLTDHSKMYRNINGHIGVTSRLFPFEGGDYMHYFSENIHMDGSHKHVGIEPNEWYPYYHLRSVEWFNVISPLTRSNLPHLMQESIQFPTLRVQELENDAAIVRVDIPLEQVDIADLLPVKQLLYDGLYPGMRELPKEVCLDAEYLAPIAKLRMEWECVPILDDEIMITDESIVFFHKRCTLPEI